MINQQQRRLQELGDFLHTRRDRLAPEDAGFSRENRRRSPGLKRAEVAQLAGVSTDWYTWLEQGRPIHVSIQVLERLVLALHLDTNEREHLFYLAHQQSPPETATRDEVVSPVLQRYLDNLGNNPAFVTNRYWDVVALNRASQVVFLGDRRHSNNMVKHIFTDPLYRQTIVDWEGHARRILAEFRASCGRYLEDTRLMALIQDLMSSSLEFRTWWPNHEVLNASEGRKTVNHPQAGCLMFEHLAFQVFDLPGLKVTVYNPLDDTDTPERLNQLLHKSANMALDVI